MALTVTDRVIRYLYKIPDPVQRAATANELLGRAWMSIIEEYERERDGDPR